MNINVDFQNRLIATFQPLNNRAASRSFPSPAYLANALSKATPRAGAQSRTVTPELASHFGTAAVDMWWRSVHSFLISTSLTEASPIWASVSGYYSSHYSVRGIAHLLGYFYLFNDKKLVHLEPKPNSFSCLFSDSKGTNSGEHKLYWVLVKQDPVFAADPLFTENKQNTDESDAAHRNFANYIDHLCNYPTFRPLDKDTIINRVDHISKIIFQDVPIPRKSKFPDVEYVQLIAYHRLVSFRKILDEVLGASNRFWTVNRNPSFATGYTNFQLAEATGLPQPDQRR